MFKYLVLTTFSFLIIVSSALAVPDLQLFIDGATYDWETETWRLASAGSIDLYVISANYEYTDVIVSMALTGFSELNPPGSGISVSGFGGPDIDEWRYGFGPIATIEEWNSNEDLPRHGVFPAWFAEAHTGPYNFDDFVGDVQPDEGTQLGYWNPATNTGGNPVHPGHIEHFSLNINAPVGTGVFFDAYTLDGTAIDKFAPFSHNAGTTIVPEPGTIILMGSGLMGIGFGAFRRRKKK